MTDSELVKAVCELIGSIKEQPVDQLENLTQLIKKSDKPFMSFSINELVALNAANNIRFKVMKSANNSTGATKWQG
jgi:hypothetical protein